MTAVLGGRVRRQVAYGTSAQVAGRLAGAAISIITLRLSTERSAT